MGLDVLQGLVHSLGQGGGIGVGAGGQPGMLAAAEGMLNQIELRGIGGEKFEGDLLRRQFCTCRVHGSMAVCQALKEAGSGSIPWPPEARDGNVWPVALQLLVSMLQDECVAMDLNGDLFVGVEEALPAFRDGIIGPLTHEYNVAWLELKKLSETWVDGWATADLDALWRQGEIGIRTTGG